MAAGIVVGCVLLSRDQLVRVEELPVGSSPNFVWERPGEEQRLLRRSVMKVLTWWRLSNISMLKLLAYSQSCLLHKLIELNCVLQNK